jgi:hypothetical protein
VLGDPLISDERPITPPGVHHANPAVETMVRMALAVVVVALVAAFVLWFRSVSPDDDWCAREVTCQPQTPQG